MPATTFCFGRWHCRRVRDEIFRISQTVTSLPRRTIQRIDGISRGNSGTARKRLFILKAWCKNCPMYVHHVLIWLIRFPAQTVILYALVWIMIKLQKLDQNSEFHFLKLLGVVTLASVLETLPFVGIELSGLALWMGVKYVTRAPTVDALLPPLFPPRSCLL